MGIVSVDPNDPTPIYAQLERGLRAAIATGRLKPGDQLPTVRQLAVELRVNANTVARVYAELERAGVLRPGAASVRSSAPRRRRPTRPANTNAACAPSSHGCWRKQTPRDSRSTICSNRWQSEGRSEPVMQTERH